jgi:hypothetical protein
MNQRAEPSAAWAFNVDARNRLYLNAPQPGSLIPAAAANAVAV